MREQNDDLKQKLEAVKILFDLFSNKGFVQSSISMLNLPIPQTFQLQDIEEILPSRLHEEDSLD